MTRRILVQPDQFERRAAELQREGKLSRPAVNPSAGWPMTGPWSGNNNLGGAVKGSDFILAAGVQKKATIVVLPEWGFPVQWTVSLGVIDDTASEFHGLEAEIKFGVGGSVQTVRCDWIHGTALTVTANAIEVNCTLAGTYSEADLARLQIMAQLSHYPRPGALSPIITLLAPVSVAAGADSAVVAIPPFVGIVDAVCATTDAAAATDVAAFYSDLTTLRLLAGANAGSTVAAKRGSDLRLSPGLNVFGQAKNAIFENDSAVTFEMAIFGRIVL